MADTSRPQRLVFGEDAELYDRARAGYPASLFDDLTALCGGPGAALDAGCGTGKAAVPLAERGWSGVGVEPDEAMAAVARRRLAAYPGWSVDQAGWETYSGPAAPVDLLTSAQAWHWFDPEVRLARAHAALAPEGLLALWWNRGDEMTAESAAQDEAIEAVYGEVVPGFAARGPGSKGSPPDVGSLAGFDVVLETSYRWSRRQTAVEFVETLHTQSDHRLLPSATFERLAAGIIDAVERHGGHAERDHRTDLWVARRRS